MTESATLRTGLSNHELGQIRTLGEDNKPKTAKRTLRLAYLTTEYPKASHTFVRRELLAVENLGHKIQRLSIPDALATCVDPADKAEAAKTTICLNQSKLGMIVSTIKAAITRPGRFVDALRTTFKLWKASDRSWIKHLAYLVEAASLLPVLKRDNVEHIHVHFGKNAADVALMIKKLGGPGYSLMIHGPGEFDGPRTFSLGEKVAESRFTVAISHFATGQLRRWVDFKHWGKLHVVRCTIGEDFLREIHPVDPDSRKLVCIGRLTGQKGQLLLIDAVHQLVEQGLDVTLVLCGDGEMRNAIEARIAELGIEDHVEITGWIGEKEVRRHLIESRGMVLPSFAEGLPVAIMEALALGRPVVSTSIAGIPELLRNGENGWVIPSGCMEDLVRALRELLEADGDRLNELGRARTSQTSASHGSRSRDAGATAAGASGVAQPFRLLNPLC